MAYLLLMDTCGEGGGVGIALDDYLVAQRPLPGRETQERLMGALAEVLAEAAVTLADLAAIAVVTGPGSFTGVRIGLAAAKGLAEAAGLPLIGISRLAVLAAQGTQDTVQAWIDAGRGDVFVGHYSDGVAVWEDMVPGGVALDGVGGAQVVVMEERLAALYPSAIAVAPVGVREALPLALDRLRLQDFADTALLNANYLRVPDAELALRARLAAQ